MRSIGNNTYRISEDDVVTSRRLFLGLFTFSKITIKKTLWCLVLKCQKDLEVSEILDFHDFINKFKIRQY